MYEKFYIQDSKVICKDMYEKSYIQDSKQIYKDS